MTWDEHVKTSAFELQHHLDQTKKDTLNTVTAYCVESILRLMNSHVNAVKLN